MDFTPCIVILEVEHTGLEHINPYPKTLCFYSFALNTPFKGLLKVLKKTGVVVP